MKPTVCHICEISSGIGDGQPVWKLLPVRNGDGGGIQSEGII